MQNAVAFANNDVITVAWSYGQKLERCMGFAVYRVDSKGKETALPAVAVRAGGRRLLARLFRADPHLAALCRSRRRRSRVRARILVWRSRR